MPPPGCPATAGRCGYRFRGRDRGAGRLSPAGARGVGAGDLRVPIERLREDLALVPAEARLVLSLDFDRLRATPGRNRLQASPARALEHFFAELARGAGIDLLTQVRRLLVALPGERQDDDRLLRDPRGQPARPGARQRLAALSAKHIVRRLRGRPGPRGARARRMGGPGREPEAVGRADRRCRQRRRAAPAVRARRPAIGSLVRRDRTRVAAPASHRREPFRRSRLGGPPARLARRRGRPQRRAGRRAVERSRRRVAGPAPAPSSTRPSAIPHRSRKAFPPTSKPCASRRSAEGCKRRSTYQPARPATSRPGSTISCGWASTPWVFPRCLTLESTLGSGLRFAVVVPP